MKMKILHLSDTHGLHGGLKKLPRADVVIHSGDVSRGGTVDEIAAFVEWLGGLDAPHKIFVAGNHDECLDGATVEGLPDGCHYLCHSGITIDGVKFWGVPMLLSDEISGFTPEIPDGVDMLISHRPPLGVLDEADGNHYGCPDLLNAVRRVRPCLHLFGHVHAAHGTMKIGDTTFSNGSLTDEKYQLRNQPHVLDI